MGKKEADIEQGIRKAFEASSEREGEEILIIWNFHEHSYRILGIEVEEDKLPFEVPSSSYCRDNFILLNSKD